MYPDPKRLEDISTIRDAMRQISLEAQAIVAFLDVRIEDQHLDGSTEVEDVRTILELIHSLTLEVSEDLDTYQDRYSGL
jgi:hypothetical protein